MLINVIGACDKRPVTFCIMKILQQLGDVLYITTNTRLKRLSDTGESGGHYQNTMIGVTDSGIDDFFSDFDYNRHDFDFVIADNVIVVDADLIINVEGVTTSENEEYLLSLIEEYKTIKLYKDKLVEPTTLYKLEQFEANRDMTPMTPKVVKAVANVLSEILNMPVDRLVTMGLRSGNGPTNKGRSFLDGRPGIK